jgi:nickel transport protein
MTAHWRAARTLLLGWLLTLVLVPAPHATAHTAGGRILSGKAAIAEFRFSDGSPMAFADIKVFSPSQELWLAGRADGAGRFAFMPDKAGEWALEAREAEGHSARLSLAIAADDLATTALISRYWGFVLLGSVALNLLLLSLRFGRRPSPL